MLAVAVIVFREVLEAALIISIVLAASYGIPGRGRWVATGVGAGVLGALVVALGAAGIADAFAGAGQELLNAGVLLLAVAMLAWHNIWMARHGREMAAQARALGQDILAGNRPLTALAVITAAATLREGAETVLFIAGIATSADESLVTLGLGAVLGLGAGIALGIALYAGLLRIPARRLFAVTGWMVLVLAAGLAAQAAGFLVQADLLPALGDQVWDTSFILSEGSLPGRVLHTLLGYVARPAGIQLLAYLATLAAIGVPMWLMARPTRGQIKNIVAALAFGASLLATAPAAADLQVRYPTIDEGEWEFEHNGLVTIDSRKSGKNGLQSYTGSISYGATPFWKLEIEGEASAGGGQSLRGDALTFENTFQLTPPGKYFIDIGFFAEYSQTRGRRSPNEIVFGPIFQKELPNVFGVDTLHTLNLFLGREVGPHASSATSFKYAWQSRLLLNPYLDPAIEFYGSIENLGRAGRYATQEHFVGPALVGGIGLGFGKLKYEIGYMFGLSEAAPRGAVRWKMELEFRF